MARWGLSIAAGALYVLPVLTVAFALGVVRTLLLTPHLGPLLAVAVELPLVLLWSWWVCGRIVARLAIPPRPGPRLLMGAVAFAVLMAAEAGLGLLLDAPPRAIATPEGMLGLAGQIGFALIPVLRR